MNITGNKRHIVAGSLLLLLIALFIIIFNWQGNQIKRVTLTSPNNLAFQNQLEIDLEHPGNVYIQYWIKGSDDRFRTVKTDKSNHIIIPLLMLKTDTTYEYRIVVDGLIPVYSKVLSFKTRKQSPWLVYKWVKEEAPHDASSLSDGLVMLCFGRVPGYVAMVMDWAI